ncbi:MAG: YbjQ family protein [Candidatus Melainabacteria bacterium]
MSIPMADETGVILTNIEEIPGRRVTRHHGLVCGSLVRSKHAGSDLLAGIQNVFGGELGGYTKLLDETREEATKRMITQAKSLGANAVLNVRFSTSSVAQGAAEIYVYGTAVTVE